ncbi:MAG: Wzz/FepE/Etk N-terminal domain-containing protein [Thermotaleaceae bacterium]
MEYEIDLSQIYCMLMRRKWFILCITMLGITLSQIYSFFIVEPIYKANVSIIIGKEDTQFFLEDKYTNNDVMLYLKVAKTYEEIAKSRIVRNKAEGLLEDEVFKGIIHLQVSAKSDTQVLNITVSHGSPQAAVMCADALAKSFIQVANEVLPASQLKILDKAEWPKMPVSPNYKLNMAIGAVLGMMVAVGLIFLLEYLNPTIESEEDIRRYLEFPVLGIVPQ